MTHEGAMMLRLDRLLWFLRFAPSRAVAQTWVAEGHVRVGGRRAVKPSHPVRVGDVLTLPLRDAVLVIELLEIPARRGPPAAARACYAIAAGQDRGAESDSQGAEMIDVPVSPRIGGSQDSPAADRP